MSWRREWDSRTAIVNNLRRSPLLAILASVYAGFKHFRNSRYSFYIFFKCCDFDEKGYHWYHRGTPLADRWCEPKSRAGYDHPVCAILQAQSGMHRPMVCQHIRCGLCRGKSVRSGFARLPSQVKGDGGAATEFAIDVHGTAVELCNTVYDAEPQTEGRLRVAMFGM